MTFYRCSIIVHYKALLIGDEVQHILNWGIKLPHPCGSEHDMDLAPPAITSALAIRARPVGHSLHAISLLRLGRASSQISLTLPGV